MFDLRMLRLRARYSYTMALLAAFVCRAMPCAIYAHYLDGRSPVEAFQKEKVAASTESPEPCQRVRVDEAGKNAGARAAERRRRCALRVQSAPPATPRRRITMRASRR